MSTRQSKVAVSIFIFFAVVGTVYSQNLPTAQVLPTTINAGIVTKGSSGSASFTVTNSGGETLSVSNISSSNPQFTVSPTNFSLAANASQTVTVTFSPNVVGWEQSTLTISHNGSNGPTTTVTANGIGRVTPPIGSLADTRIAFTSRPLSFTSEIYTMNADGGTLTRLPDQTESSQPSWSPDGCKIAFVSYREIDSNYEIYVMNADGSGRHTNLTKNAATDLGPSWSPDAKKIAFQSDRDGTLQIYVMNADGTTTTPTRLTGNLQGEGENEYPSWSPDGTKIVFGSTRDGNEEIYVMKADGTEQKRLTRISPSDRYPSWSPDGSKIAFQSDRDGIHHSYEIYVMNADGTEQKRLTNNLASDQRPSWSPDAKKIAFCSDRDDPNYEIYVMNADGTEQKRLTINSATDVQPSWSPFLISPPAAPTLPPFQNAIYVWPKSAVGVDKNEAQRLADFAVAKGIKTIYYSVEDIINNSILPDIISLLHGKGLQVEALYASSTNKKALLIKDRVLDVVKYNNNHPNALFDGIRLDIERGSFSNGSKPSTPEDLKLYADAVLHANGLPVYASISSYWDYWYDIKDNPTSPLYITYEGVTQEAYKHIIDIVAGVDVQTTQDSPSVIAKITKEEVCYANDLCKRVDITIETSDTCALKRSNTFLDEGEDAMESALAKLNYASVNPPCPNPRPSGFAFHFYKHAYGSPTLPGWGPDTDGDGDGISDAVDTDPTTSSNNFSDGTTKGSISNREDQSLWIADAQDLTKGVLIQALPGGTTPAKLSVCEGGSPSFDPISGSVTPGTEFTMTACDAVVVTCGSVTVDVIQGTVEMTLVPADGPPATTSLKENNSLTFEPTTFTITAPATNPDPVIVSVTGTISGESATTQGTISLSGGNGMTFNPITFTITTPATNPTPLSISIGGTSFTLDPGKRESPPVAKAGVDRSVECASSTGTSVKLDGSGSTDPDNDSLSFRWSASGISFDDATSPTPTGTFPLGKTIVTLVVNDGKVDSKPDTVEISIVDTTPPTITVAAPIKLWPPNSKYVAINLAQCVVSVQDICAGAIAVDKVMITSVSSDEPEDAKGGGDGNTTDDILIAADCKSAQLRSERQGDGNGRVYTIKLSVDDGHGNIGTANCQVAVPHDQGGPPAVDDGPIYTVIGNCNPPAAPSISSNQPVLTLEGKVTVDFASRNFAQRIGIGSEASNALRFIVVNNRSTGAMLKVPAGLNDNDRTNFMNSRTSWPFRLTIDLTSTPVQAGDLLEVTVQTASPRVGVQPAHYVVSAEDLRARQIYLPNLIVYEIPEKTLLLNNYPNPFNPETWIPYQLAEEAQVSLRIYDITGAVIRTIDVGYKHAAVYESKGRAIHWDGRNDLGERIASGIYFYHLKAGKYQAIRKMVIVK